MNDTDTGPPQRQGTGSAAWLRDPDATVQRVRLIAIAAMLLLTVGVGLVTRSPWQVLATLASATLMLLNFQGLIAVTDAILTGSGEGIGWAQGAFLLGRYALLALVLCAIVLAPGVGPIPVILGLSVLVIAILLEAVLQLFGGTSRRP